MKYFLYLCLLLLKIALIFFITSANASPIKLNSIQEQLMELERAPRGRLGLSAINTANNMRIQYRAEERFPIGCTSKVIGVAAILKKSELRPSLLQKKIHYSQQDINRAIWAPITKNHIGEGMTLSGLCGAAIMQSDNAAMNLLLKTMGGPQAVVLFARTLGDNSFRLDRWYPAEAASVPGDLRDTSSPFAMEKSFQQLVLGDRLAPPQREQLIHWLKNSTTGFARIRAGVPKGWTVGDKTGTGAYGTSNDIGIIWPPHCPPIVLSIFFTQYKKDVPLREEVLAAATQIIVNEFARTDPCIKKDLGGREGLRK